MSSIFNKTGDVTVPGHYGPSQTALLLLDFHSLFVDKMGPKHLKDAALVAGKAATWARSQGIQVIHALIDVNQEPFPTCKDRERFASIIATAKATGGDKEPAYLLEGGENDLTFYRKPGHVSAAKSPGLKKFLQEKGIKSLVLTGLSTSGCVMRTAIGAADGEFVVTTLSDGCADPEQDVHDLVVRKMLTSRGYVVTAAEFQEGFGKAAGGQ